MAWKLDNDRPIYIQILEELERRIIVGIYPSGDKMPSVRELAAQASVNPNTMQRAMSELETKGLVTTMRTSGRTVTNDSLMIAKKREELANRQIRSFLDTMKQYGFQREEIMNLINSCLKGDEYESHY